MKNVPITIILSLIVLLAATGIGHALMEEMSLEDLTRGASHIVVGTVDRIEVDSVGTSDGESMIYTFVDLMIEERLKGRFESESVVVRVEGGNIGDFEVCVEDQPNFQVGQRALVFLRQVDAGLFGVYGAFQGVREPSDENLSKIKLILSGISPGVEDESLSLAVTTDKSHYDEGEDVLIRITAKNEGNEEITLHFPSELQAYYIIDGWFRGPKDWNFTENPTSVTIPPVESHTWEFVHTSEDARLDAGIHTIVGLAARPFYEFFPSLQATTEITVGDLSQIEGTVKDEGGLALPDVRIVGYRKWNIPGIEPLPTDPDMPDGELFPVPMLEPLFAATDANGQFVFENLPVGESYLIGAFKEGYDLVWSEIPITSEVVPLDLVLPEAVLVTVTGQVSDQNHAPVVEADIRGMAYPDFGWLDFFVYDRIADDEEPALSYDVNTVEALFGSMEPWRSDLRPWLPLSRSFTASTNVDGRFVFEGVPVGWHLSVHSAKMGYEPAFTEVAVTAEPDDVNMTMTKLRLGQIRGIVTDTESKAPIPGAHIVAYPVWDETEPVFDGQSVSGEVDSLRLPYEDPPFHLDIISYPSPWGPYHAVTDANGEFTLDEVNLDMTFVLWAYMEGYNPAHAEVVAPSESPYVEIALTKIEMAVLTGIVTDDAGQVVPGAEVLVYPELYPLIHADSTAFTEPRRSFEEYTAFTDDDGGFVVERLPLGCTVTVSARKRGYEVAHQRVEIAEKTVFVQLFLIALEEEYPNRNAVLRDGIRYEVAMDRMVYNPDETAQLRYRVMNLTEEVKTFSFPTTQRVEFFVLSMDRTKLTPLWIDPDGNSECLEIVVWRWSDGQEFGQTLGEFTLAQGETATFEAMLDLSVLGSDERGFLLHGFLAELDDTQAHTRFEIERDVLIDAQVTIAGIVVDGEGRPLARANVAARTADVALRSESADIEHYTVVTDENGCFELQGLYRGGTYEVTAFREGYTLQQKIVYAIQEQNHVRFVLLQEGSEKQYANASVFVNDGVRIELLTDRHFYAGADDVIRMCYRITNAREAPIVFNFSDGQQVDFVLKKDEHVIWRWSDGRGFTDAPTTLEIPKGASKAFKTEVALEALDVADGNLLLSAYLTLPENAEKTRISLELTIGMAYEVVYVGAEDAGIGPIVLDSRTGMVVELLAPSGTVGRIEFSETTRNTLGDLAGYWFLRMVDFRPDPVLSAFVEQIYVEIRYDEAQLNALGIESEEAVHLFIWDASGDAPGWRRVEGGVDTEHNVAWGNVPTTGTQWALFAAKPMAVEEPGDPTPSPFALAQNVPNPFNPSTTIRFSIPNQRDAKVALVIYNTMGQRIRTLVDGAMDAGAHVVVWNGLDDRGRAVSSGVYLYRLRTGGNIQTRKMLLIR